MRNFKIGDWVYASDWCYGQIENIEDGIALVEYFTPGGGGCCSFLIDDLQKAEPPKKNYELTINIVDTIRELEESKYHINDTEYARGANAVIDSYIKKLKDIIDRLDEEN